MVDKKIILIMACLLILIPVLLSAQVAAEIDTILKSPEVTCAQAARFVATSVGGLSATRVTIPANSFEKALEDGWFPKETQAEEIITLKKLSFLLMKAFDMKGGFMYRLFPGPHYAYKSMVSKNIIQGAADPSWTVSGEKFFLILGRVLDAEGGEK